MERLRALQVELESGLAAYPATAGEHKYYAKQLATLQNGITSLLAEAAIDATELRLHALFYEAEELKKQKDNVAAAGRLAEIETEASALRNELLARRPRPTRRLFSGLTPPQ